MTWFVGKKFVGEDPIRGGVRKEWRTQQVFCCITVGGGLDPEEQKEKYGSFISLLAVMKESVVRFAAIAFWS